MIDTLAALSTEHVIRFGWLAAIAIELATVVMRFGWGMRSPETTKCCARFTGGFRVHHGYVGVALLVLAWAFPLPAAAASVLWISGIALALSDAIHHFAVLWPLTGSPEFHIRYPRADDCEDEMPLALAGSSTDLRRAGRDDLVEVEATAGTCGYAESAMAYDALARDAEATA